MADQTINPAAMQAPEVLVELMGSLGVITLNRPKALNALSLPMIGILGAAMRDLVADPRVGAILIRATGEKAFCAGGDVRAIGVAQGAAADGLKRAFFGDEYRVNYAIARCPKPVIAIMDGITMGGGCGLSLHASHRVATERTVVAMPETMLGLFPDVGGTAFLNALPGEMGVYLGLTGTRLRAADLLGLGMATHHLAAARIPDLVTALAAVSMLDAREVGVILGQHHQPSDQEIDVIHRLDRINRLFAGATIDAIMTALDQAPEPWAVEAAKGLHKASPTSLKLTLRQLREGRTLDLETIFKVEYRLAVRATAAHDFPEGVRAILVDKDHAPKWSPHAVCDVDDALIDGFFQPFADPTEEWHAA